MSLFFSINYLIIFLFIIYFIITSIDEYLIIDYCNFTLSDKSVIILLKYFLIIMFIICLIVIVFNYKIEKLLRFEFLYILVFSFIGMILLVLANDLLIMFLSLELQTFGFYLLIAIQQKRSFLQKQVLNIIY